MTRLDATHLELFAARVRSVGPDTRPRWGKMNPAQVFRHLRLFLEISLGQVEVPDHSNFLTRTLGYWLTFHVMPHWPHGVKVPAHYIPPAQQNLEEQKRELLAAMQQFVDRAAAHPAECHLSETFGWKTLRTWARIHGRHFDHHLRQLGA